MKIINIKKNSKFWLKFFLIFFFPSAIILNAVFAVQCTPDSNCADWYGCGCPDCCGYCLNGVDWKPNAGTVRCDGSCACEGVSCGSCPGEPSTPPTSSSCIPGATTCGSCSASCDGGKQTCTDGCTTWTPDCNTQPCCGRNGAACCPDTNNQCGLGLKCEFGTCASAPCEIQTPGCYNKDNIKVSYGLYWDGFGFYLTANRCKKVGECSCEGIPENVQKYTEPDESQQSCGCMAHAVWNDNSRCCGDDLDTLSGEPIDCGKITSGILCSYKSDFTNAEHLAVATNKGKIKYLECGKSEYLSDGTNWFKCDGVFTGGAQAATQTKTIDGNEFMCIGRGKGSIVECCGGDGNVYGGCKSGTDSGGEQPNRLRTGESANPSKFRNEGEPATTQPECQDGYKNREKEECDKKDDRLDLNGKTCQTLGYPGGTLGCNDDCTFDKRRCTGTPTATGGSCGDGTIQKPNDNGVNEECDGTNLGENVCGDFKDHSGGELQCSDCKFNFEKCTIKVQQPVVPEIDYVTLYENDGYTGYSVNFYPGSYPKLSIYSCCGDDFNDEPSSIKVPEGLHATLYEKDNYNGDFKVFTQSDSSFSRSRSWQNDETSSIIVRRISPITTISRVPQPSDYVTVFEHTYYSGASANFIAGSHNLEDSELKNKVSSIKVPNGIHAKLCYKNPLVIGSSCSDYNTDSPDLSGFNDRATSIQVYNGITLCNNIGTCLNFFANDQSLSDNNMNDKATSIRVAPGYKAILCEHDNYGGICETFTEGRHNLRGYSLTYETAGGLASKVSSVKVFIQGVEQETSSSTTQSPTGASGSGSGGGKDVDGLLQLSAMQTKSVRITQNLITGFAIAGEENTKTFYCAPDKKFVTDLDTPELQKTNTAINAKNQQTCEKAGFKWTGTKCCSEDDDNLTTSTLREFYNERSNPSSCWNSTLVTSVNLVSGTADSVINFGDGFHGCAIDKNNFNTNNNFMLNIIDKHANSFLLPSQPQEQQRNHPYCYNNPKGYFCSYTEKWVLSEGRERTRLSYAPASAAAATVVRKPYFSFTPNGGNLRIGESGSFTLHNAKPGDKLFIKARKDNKPFTFEGKEQILLCEVPNAPGIASCAKGFTAGATDIGDWEETVFINGNEAGKVKFTVDTQQTPKKPYFEFTPNGGTLIAGKDSLTISLKNAQPGTTFSVTAWKDGEQVTFGSDRRQEAILCPVGPSETSCTRTIIPQAQDAGEWLEKIKISGREAGEIRFEVKAAGTAECCENSKCWNGNLCIDSQKTKPREPPLGRQQPDGDGYRCIDGEWKESSLKYTSDEGAPGYCPKETQCLLDPTKTEEAEQCAEPGIYREDSYCEDGNWTTRTKLLASKLLEMRSADFTLFCDTKENTLNNLQYQAERDIIGNILRNDLQTNNFCVLSSGNKVFVASSTNQNLDRVLSKNILGVRSCSMQGALANDGAYHPCDSSNKVWLNSKLKSFIYSSGTISVPSGQPQKSLFEQLIKNPVMAIVNSIKELIGIGPYDDSYTKQIRKFDKLYITKQGSREITGNLDGRYYKNAVIKYNGFETDICRFVDSYNQIKKPLSSGISCKKEGNSYYVLAQGSAATNLNPESIWLDLTSKLRLT